MSIGIVVVALVLLPFTCIRVKCERTTFPKGSLQITAKDGAPIKNALLLGCYWTLEGRVHGPTKIDMLTLRTVALLDGNSPIADREHRGYAILHPLMLTSDCWDQILIGYFVIAPGYHARFFAIDRSRDKSSQPTVWQLDAIQPADSKRELTTWLTLLDSKELRYQDLAEFKDTELLRRAGEKGLLEYEMLSQRKPMEVAVNPKPLKTARDFINQSLAQ